MVAWKMPTFFNVWRLTVVYSYSKKMLESGDNHNKKTTRITCTERKSKLRRTLAKDNLLALNGHVARHGEFWATKPNAMRYIGRVITTSVTSHFVEQLFSTLKHETTGKRVNTKVETVAHYLHLKSMPTIKEEPDPEDGNFPIEPPPAPPFFLIWLSPRSRIFLDKNAPW